MHYRPVLTPSETKPSDFDFDLMVRNLDLGRELCLAEEQRVFRSLPLTVFRSYPVMTIEPSKRYTDSIALVTRERKQKFLFSYIETNSVELRICGLADLADELEFFESVVVGGDAFQRVSTVLQWHGDLAMRCDRGTYELESSVHDADSRSGRAEDLVRMNWFAFKELIGVLRAFGTSSSGWKERHLASRH